MKMIIVALTLLAAGSAHADLSADVQGKAVRCTGSEFAVVINQARTEITVINQVDPGHPEQYSVSPADKMSDGDTYATYTGTDLIDAGSESVVLSFDNRGDTLTYKGQAALALHCK